MADGRSLIERLTGISVSTSAGVTERAGDASAGERERGVAVRVPSEGSEDGKRPRGGEYDGGGRSFFDPFARLEASELSPGVIQILRSYAALVSRELGLNMPFVDATEWVAVVYDRGSMPADFRDFQAVMAMAGDATLKAGTCVLHMYANSTAKETSDVLTKYHTNAYMSGAFANSPLANGVIVAAGVNMGTGRVGATFLEALAMLMEKYHGRVGVLACLKYFYMTGLVWAVNEAITKYKSSAVVKL